LPLLVADELAELIDEEELDNELDVEEDEDEGVLDDELDEREDELLLAGVEELLELERTGAEHSLTPPATLPPKVASLQTKLPLSTL